MRNTRSIARVTAIAACLAAAAVAAPALAQSKAAAADVKRGEFLALFGGCNDCHTPKTMTPQGPAPDQSRLLMGHPADAALPPMPAGTLGPGKWMAVTNEHLTAWAGPWGVSFAANLTPDTETGLGKWTYEQFVQTMRTGKHLGVGRPVLPPMPWPSISALDDKDMRALFAYLRSLKPIRNAVPLPMPPKQ